MPVQAESQTPKTTLRRSSSPSVASRCSPPTGTVPGLHRVFGQRVEKDIVGRAHHQSVGAQEPPLILRRQPTASGESDSPKATFVMRVGNHGSPKHPAEVNIGQLDGSRSYGIRQVDPWSRARPCRPVVISLSGYRPPNDLVITRGARCRAERGCVPRRVHCLVGRLLIAGRRREAYRR
jgi:hypothetical protein